MDANEEDATPPRANLKRRPTAARMHASPTKSAKKRKVDVQARPQVRPRSQRSTVGSSLGGQDWIVTRMNGACPPFNDFANWVHDPHSKKVYMVGGMRPGKDLGIPMSDFYCYNTTNMKWENLTNRFTFRESFDPYSEAGQKREKKLLPRLGYAGCTLWRRGQHSFLFIFGGHDYETEKASSKVIIVNLETLEWTYEQRMEKDVDPRIAPAIVAIENKVYIFGGYMELEGTPRARFSYSIAEWRPEDPMSGGSSTWTWEVRDHQYSGQMPRNSVVGQAVAVYGGKKILLTPGRLNHTDKRPVHFTENNIFYFQIEERIFQRILGPVGDPLPQNIGWYSVFDFKQPSPSPQSSSSTDSVMICAWIPRPGSDVKDEEYAPELYRFSLTAPNDRIDCLNIVQKVWDLDHNFEGFMVVDGKMNLFGSNSHSRNPSATWNMFIGIPFPDPRHKH